MVEQAKFYLIKHKDPEINNSYLISVKEGKTHRTIRDYSYSRKGLNITFDEIDNYEIVYFKTVKYGSGYELKTIKNYYIKNLNLNSL